MSAAAGNDAAAAAVGGPGVGAAAAAVDVLHRRHTLRPDEVDRVERENENKSLQNVVYTSVQSFGPGTV